MLSLLSRCSKGRRYITAHCTGISNFPLFTEGLGSQGNYRNPLKHHGLKSIGSGGSSRISVIVTRLLAAMNGSSGNSGCVSARPDTM